MDRMLYIDRKGVKQLIAQCQNSIYGKIAASLIYHNSYRNILEDEGFEFNPYDPCVANNIIKVSHIYVCFHVEYCKLSHKILKLVGNTITWIKQ